MARYSSFLIVMGICC